MWNKWFFQNLFYFISRVRSRWNKINVKYNKLKRFLRVFAIINIHEAKLLQCCSQSRPTDDCYVTRIRPAYVLVTSRKATPRFHFLYFISDVRTYTNLKYIKINVAKNNYFISFYFTLDVRTALFRCLKRTVILQQIIEKKSIKTLTTTQTNKLHTDILSVIIAQKAVLWAVIN